MTLPLFPTFAELRRAPSGISDILTSVQDLAPLPRIDCQEIHRKTPEHCAAGGLPKVQVLDPRLLIGLRIFHEFDMDVHAEQAHDHDTGSDHHGSRR